ncbi:preprotein translocase subunit SecE [Patescibacteria group bacterium]|nr:preprotein translocase subunit SecE [Patescibacteria group bacterium]MBU2579769.1 preprotein translocase subunit SecE [Patescibacteria group bacterium]MBU4030913.1 preprotein translocase subunit SecE [Patescibacteria group bacterium]MBU4082367.1 preprotein translocase subunit SecE [Patescibacteria group bacterium]MCG2808847.1 preprotein translocase subunit SecE [Candidatus Portnoybacteria bacterium]
MQISKIPAKVAEFLSEVRLELKKVTWPTRQETIKYTTAVIVFSLVLSAFLGGLDFLFSWLLNKFVI